MRCSEENIGTAGDGVSPEKLTATLKIWASRESAALAGDEGGAILLWRMCLPEPPTIPEISTDC